MSVEQWLTPEQWAELVTCEARDHTSVVTMQIVAVATIPLLRELAAVREALHDHVDPEPCWFDHHGGCQEHGYLSLKPGEVCPSAAAKALLAGCPGVTS